MGLRWRGWERELPGALALMAGLLVAVEGLYLAYGLRDGFDDPALWAYKRRILRRLPWLLAAAALAGPLLHRFHEAWLDPKARKAAAWLLLAVPRAFLHFPFFGAVTFAHLLLVLLSAPFRGLARRFLRRPVAPAEVGSLMEESTALWMVVAPFTALGGTGSQGASGPLPALAWRLPRLLPALLAALFVWSGAVSEDSGERVDPFLLSLAAACWFGDYFLVAWCLWDRRSWRATGSSAPPSPGG